MSLATALFSFKTNLDPGCAYYPTMDVALELNHLALLQHRAKTRGNTVLLKILKRSEPIQQWTNVTVAEFAADVDRVANFLVTELKARDIPARSVVSV